MNKTVKSMKQEAEKESGQLISGPKTRTPSLPRTPVPHRQPAWPGSPPRPQPQPSLRLPLPSPLPLQNAAFASAAGAVVTADVPYAAVAAVAATRRHYHYHHYCFCCNHHGCHHRYRRCSHHRHRRPCPTVAATVGPPPGWRTYASTASRMENIPQHDVCGMPSSLKEGTAGLCV
jgi:hypothetical protein